MRHPVRLICIRSLPLLQVFDIRLGVPLELRTRVRNKAICHGPGQTIPTPTPTGFLALSARPGPRFYVRGVPSSHGIAMREAVRGNERDRRPLNGR
jgi:hypothetical protein